MYQTVYPKLRTPERHPRAEAAHHARPAGGPVDGVCDLFMRLPNWVMLAAMWLLGVALLGSGVLVLYVLAALVATVVG